jgi:hypothetical protein
MLAMFFVPIASPLLNITAFAHDLFGRSPSIGTPEQVVKEYGLGLRPGDNIASLGLAWLSRARLARGQIVTK